MHIALGIRMQMMMSMFRSPPQYAFLCGALREERKDELKYSACRVGSMREVSMIPASDSKHAQPVQNGTNCDRWPGDARPNRRDAPCVDRQKRDKIRIHDVVVIWIDIGGQALNLGCFRARANAKGRLKAWS